MPSRSEVSVLITAASRRVALIRGFRNAMDRLGLRGKVITTDMNALSPGLYFSDDHYLVPLTTSPDYIPIIERICAKENIRLLIPTIDDELPLFGSYRDYFREKGILIPVSSQEVNTICNDKYRTFQVLKDLGFDTPESYLPEDLDVDRLSYPLFLKPRFGRGSVGAYPIHSESELRFFLDYVGEPIVQEFLHGEEFTIDLLTDFEGKVLSVVPRQRLLIRAGVSDRGRTCKDAKLIELALSLARKLGVVGAANFQLMREGERASIFEINPRFAGGIPLTIASGADFPALLLRLAAGESPKPSIGEFRDDFIMISYEDSIFKHGEKVFKKKFDLERNSKEVEKSVRRLKVGLQGMI